MERLTQEKEKLEEEKWVKQQCVVALLRAEQRRVELAALLPEAGLSRAPPQKPERTAKGADRGLGIVIPKKNCMWESLRRWDPDGCAQSF